MLEVWCVCGRKLKRHAVHPEKIGHPGRCEYGEPYSDGTVIPPDNWRQESGMPFLAPELEAQ